MRKVLLVVAGVATLGVVSVAGFKATSTHITDCGFDANGAYAKVHINPLGQQRLRVNFFVDGRYYMYRGANDAHGTTVVWAPFPLARDHISGRTVYTDASHGNGPLHFVTKEYAEAHPGKTRTETMPDKSHTISCRFPEGGDSD
jgi:hypothetical protein